MSPRASVAPLWLRARLECGRWPTCRTAPSKTTNKRRLDERPAKKIASEVGRAGLEPATNGLPNGMTCRDGLLPILVVQQGDSQTRSSGADRAVPVDPRSSPGNET